MAENTSENPCTYLELYHGVTHNMGLAFEWRDKQLDIMHNALSLHHNTFAIFRTGYGKSECFGMATSILKKVTKCISITNIVIVNTRLIISINSIIIMQIFLFSFPFYSYHYHSFYVFPCTLFTPHPPPPPKKKKKLSVAVLFHLSSPPSPPLSIYIIIHIYMYISVSLTHTLCDSFFHSLSLTLCHSLYIHRISYKCTCIWCWRKEIASQINK